MNSEPTTANRLSYQRLIQAVRVGPLGGLWLFAYVFLAQLGHLVEHIAKQVTGAGVFGAALDSEPSHLIFNGAIALLVLVLVAVYRRNPWVYPLAVLSVFHGIEHAYIFELFVRTGLVEGPGLLGKGGAIGLIPLDRLDLHNIYNGTEVILLQLGLWHEVESTFAEGSQHACDLQFTSQSGGHD